MGGIWATASSGPAALALPAGVVVAVVVVAVVAVVAAVLTAKLAGPTAAAVTKISFALLGGLSLAIPDPAGLVGLVAVLAGALVVAATLWRRARPR